MDDESEMRSQPGPEQMARRYLGERGMPGDLSNAYFHVPAGLGGSDVKPARTYEDYIRNVKCVRNPAMADAVMRLSDPVKVAQFDGLISRMNDKLRKDASPGDKARAISPILDELEKIV